MNAGNAGRRLLLGALAAVATAGWVSGALAESRTFSFAYDQPPSTAYGVAANIFDAKLKELSGGKFSINQFPGAQLGQEPQMLQKMRAGDIDFVITSTANASTLAPQAGVFSLHFIFRDQAHLMKVLADPAITAEFRDDGEGLGAGRARARPDDHGHAQHVQQAGSALDRRHQGQEGARAGDQDRGHAVPGLRRADGAHAVWRRLYLAADRASSTSPRTASTSTSRTSTTRWRRCSRSPSTRRTTTASGSATRPGTA